MRILTVRQPWAWAIIHGGKDVENRVRNVAGGYRGPVAIHAGKVEDANAFSMSAVDDVLNAAADRWMDEAVRARPKSVETVPWARDHGRIIGVVDLVDVHGGPNGMYTGCDERLIGGGGICSPWAETQAHHLVLASPRPLAYSIPYKGALGLRTLNDSLINEITSALAEGASDDE